MLIIKNLFYNSLSVFIARATNSIGYLLLTRFISPEIFGLFTLIQVFTNLGSIIIDPGISQILVRSRDSREQLFTTALYLSLFNALIFSIATYYIAPYIIPSESFKAFNNAYYLIIIYYFTIAFQTPSKASLEKNGQFKRIAFIEASSYIISLSCSFILTYFKYDLEALISLNLVSQTIITTVFYLSIKTSLNFRKFDSELLKRIIFEIRYLMFTRVSFLVISNIEKVIIPRVNNISTLGIYNTSIRINNLPIQFSTNAFNRVLLPHYSKSDLTSIKKEHLSIITVLTSLLAPFYIVLLIFNNELASFMNKDWHNIAFFLKYGALTLLPGLFGILNESFLIATNQTKLIFYVNIIERTTKLLTISSLFFTDIETFIYLECLRAFTIVTLISYICLKKINVTLCEITKVYTRPLVLLIIATLFYTIFNCFELNMYFCIFIFISLAYSYILLSFKTLIRKLLTRIKK
ncbi:oligosaccharide flippase family protein [Halobacteriovorax sp. XZX-2]|uniref:oligosaccharide flippase family protein n=1 Tax=unclassified Halobacteriovorax TaxID=2639665 RepID=UPI003721DA56